MHELGMAMEIVDIVEKSLEGKKVKAVKEVEIDMGDLHKVSPGQMQEVFEMASKGTMVEGAKLKVNIKKGTIKCLACGFSGGVDVEMEHHHDHQVHLHCPKCNATSLEILEGRDIDVRNIEAEIED